MWCQIFSSVYTEQVAKLLLLSKQSWFWDPIIPSSKHPITLKTCTAHFANLDETKQCQKPSKPFKNTQKNSCLRCASLHVIPIGDNAMLDGVLQCQHTSLALGFISNIAVLLVHANHNSGHLWSADDGWENCSRSIVTSKTGFAHSASVVHHQSSHLFVTHGYKLRLRQSINWINWRRTAIWAKSLQPQTENLTLNLHGTAQNNSIWIHGQSGCSCKMMLQSSIATQCFQVCRISPVPATCPTKTNQLTFLPTMFGEIIREAWQNRVTHCNHNPNTRI